MRATTSLARSRACGYWKQQQPWAGPMCAAVLADLGADVIKVEIPSGDVGRAIQPNLPGTDVGFMHATVNRNKRGLSLDTRTEAGRDIFLKLAESSDILVENFKVGTMAKYGLGYDQFKRDETGHCLCLDYWLGTVRS